MKKLYGLGIFLASVALVHALVITGPGKTSLTSFTDLSWTYSDVNVLTNNFPILPAFKAYAGTLQTITNLSVDMPVAFDAEVFDNLDAYNTNTSEYILPVSGVYHFDAMLAEDLINNEKVMVPKVYVNGVTVASGVRIATGTAYDHWTSVNAIVSETNGAIVKVYVWHNVQSGITLTNASYATYFEGYFLSP